MYRVRFCSVPLPGKAAHVLKTKGCPDAMTIHQMIYNPKDKCRLKLLKLHEELDHLYADAVPEEPACPKKVKQLECLIEKENTNLKKPSFALNDNSAVRDASLVVIDERSMVNEMMGEGLSQLRHQTLTPGRSGPASTGVWQTFPC